MAVIFFDIDGTLWDYHSVIPESTKIALRLLRENGHQTFFCSGRSKPMIFGDGLSELEMDGMLAGCGTYIACQGRELYQYEIGRELLERTLVVLAEQELPVLVEGHEHLFMDRLMLEDRFGAYLRRMLPDTLFLIDETDKPVRGSKMSVLTVGREYQKAAEELMAEYEVLQHGEHVMELVPKGFSKATGIAKVCELLGIPHAETYAVGDSVNDVDMLRYAAHGIAMGNGTTEAKQAADYVTEDIHADGLYRAMAHYGLI